MALNGEPQSGKKICIRGVFSLNLIVSADIYFENQLFNRHLQIKEIAKITNISLVFFHPFQIILVSFSI